MATIQQFFNEVETPCYVYNLDVLKANVENLIKVSKTYDYQIHYAIKANTNAEILKTISSYNLGADCVSGNEIKCALKNGFKAENIVYAGVGKTDKEIEYALKQNIQCFNCESLEEIMVIEEIAQDLKLIAPIALRINPNVDAKTHAYITTGLNENKFGIHPQKIPELIDFIKKSKHIQLKGLHFHIGSQITNLEPFVELAHRVNYFIELFTRHNLSVSVINVGGGLGIDYENYKNRSVDFHSYFEIFNKVLRIGKGHKVHFELGRSIVGHCGTLVTSVLYVKKGITKDFIILDTGMTELLRPALYQAFHGIENNSSGNKNKQTYDVVGPICESSDVFGKNIELSETVRKDTILIHSTGAYGEVMASEYNLREKVKSRIWSSNMN